MIKLTDKLYLDADGQCFILQEWSGKTQTHKNGYTQNVYDSTRYYSDYSNLLNGVLKFLERKDIQKSSTLEELVANHKNTYEEMMRIGSLIKTSFNISA